MRKFKLIILLLALLLLISPLQMKAVGMEQPKDKIVYVALGDSIAEGWGASSNEKTYVNLFKEYLEKRYDSVDAYNFAKAGDTSSDLLAKLSYYNPLDPTDPKNQMSYALKKSRVITVSIGGNNLLAGLRGLMAGDLQAPEKQLGLFGKDWPMILATLHYKAPDAQIYVMNLYDPFRAGDTLNGMDMYAIGEKSVGILNSIISNDTLKSMYGYKVADVYTKFHNITEEDQSLTHFHDISNPYADPHPTDLGHKFIFLEHKQIYNQ